ncbi:MAG: head GIN domain-containing protein [Salinibacter sp.]
MTRSFSSLLATGLVLVGLLAGPASVAAQDASRQTRSVDAFTKVAFALPGTLHLRQGSTQSVELAGPSEALSRVETVVEDGRLRVRAEEDGGLSGLFDWFTDDSDETASIDVYVTMPTVEGVSVAGSGDIIAETPIETEQLNAEIAGAGGIEAEVTATRLTANIAGSGDLTLRGRADEVTVEIAGSGHLQAADLRVATAEVSTAGSGDAALHVTDRLSARLVGSGDVHYRGQPTVDTDIVGSGTVATMAKGTGGDGEL